MEWAKPLYSRSQVKEAGKRIANEGTSSEDYEVALAIVDNWRSAHSFPLNTVQNTVRRIARNVDVSVKPVQRLKRLPSISAKLVRQPNMALTMMNDIGGCRLVMVSIEDVYALKALVETRRLESTLRKPYDYIADPKPDGYRSVHFAFTYKGKQRTDWDGLRIEMQVRSQLQHAWSTAVEVVALFTGQRLKWGIGDADWKRFFVLMGSAIARREGCAAVPGTPEWGEARMELQRLAQRLEVERRLSAYTIVADFLKQTNLPKNAYYHLLRLDIAGAALTINSFRQSESQQAAIEYAALERASLLDPYVDVVLVAADSLSELQKAYPNYFADTTAFRQLVHEELT